MNWPFCEACQSYHHPENPTCYRLANGYLEAFLGIRHLAEISPEDPFKADIRAICDTAIAKISAQEAQGVVLAPATTIGQRTGNQDAHNASMEAFRAVSKAHRQAQADYRAGKIGDEAFLASRKALEAASALTDATEGTL